MNAYADFTAYAKETGSRMSDQPLLTEMTQHLDTTQQELFDYVTDFHRLSEWIWSAKKTWPDDTNSDRPGEVGSVRMIQSVAGEPVQELVKAFEEPRMLAYSANDSAFFGTCTDHLSVLTCEPHPDGGTVFCWLAYGRLPSSRIKAWVGNKLFDFVLSRGIKNLERKFPPR